MASKSKTLQNISLNKTGTATKRKQKIAFTIAAIGFMAVLALSAMNDYLFIEWLSVSAAIILCLFAIHVIGAQQIQRK